MAKKVNIEELRVTVHPEVVDIEWRRAKDYPARHGQELKWSHVESVLWEPAQQLPGFLQRFADSARSTYDPNERWNLKGPYHRVVLRLDDRLEPLFEALMKHMPEPLRPDTDSPGAPAIVWQAARSPRSTEARKPEVRLPIRVDILDVGQQDFVSEGFIRRAIEKELLAVTSVAGEPTESHILHVAHPKALIEPDFVRRLLRRRKRLPRLVIIERHLPWPLLETTFAEAVLAEGCPAAVIVDAGPPHSPSPAARLFYQKLLHDLPLDLAVHEAARISGEEVHFTLVTATGAESMQFLSQAVFEHPHTPDLRLSRVLKQVEASKPPAARKGELGQFLARRFQQVRERVLDVSSRIDGLPFTQEELSLDALVPLHEEARAVATEWQGLRSLETLGTRITFDSKSPFEAIPFSSSIDPEPDVLALPPRWTNVWLTQAPGQEQVSPETPLLPGHLYALNVQIGFTRTGVMTVGAFPLDRLAAEFQQADEVPIEVLAFARSGEVELEVKRVRITLPRFGESGVAKLPFRIPAGESTAPHRRVRIGIYHGNRLLQSGAIDLSMAPGQATTFERDFIASDELLLVDELPPVAASFFVNQGPDGSHWIGLATAQEPAVLDLDPTQIQKRVEELRKRYDHAQGMNADLYEPPLDPDSLNWGRRVEELIELAKLGRRIYFDFIVGHGALHDAQKKLLKDALSQPDSLIQIARCRESAPGLPWGTFYDYDLKKGGELSVCKVFTSQVDQTVKTGQRQDLLDTPAACRTRADCPLSQQETARNTVCPFGFWGIRHRIEQPTYAVKPSAFTPKPGGEAPRAPWLSLKEVTGDASLVVGTWNFPNTPEHLRELNALAQTKGGRAIEAKTERALETTLKTSGASIVYFYCHGDELEGSFALKVGDAQAPFMLDADTLSQWEVHWPQAPLVILNGCETLAVKPEQVHGFLVVLRDMGASGVVGPEVPIWTTLARRVGESLVQQFLSGTQLGHALQRVQRDLMRELNPMGLMYVAYARADLKLAASP
jgi:hypothetical protein